MHYIIASSKPWPQNITATQDWLLNDCFVWVNNREEFNKALEEVPDIRYIFFLHWSWRVPESIWQKFECVCFHMTNVPYGRGGSPLQNLIIRGHEETKLTALRMVNEMDAGPVYTNRRLSLDGTAHEIYIRACKLSYDIMQWMIAHDPQPVAQKGEPVIFERRKPEQSELPLLGNIENVYDHIRMLDAPTYPHAFIEYGEFLFQFTGAVVHDDELTATVRISKKV